MLKPITLAEFKTLSWRNRQGYCKAIGCNRIAGSKAQHSEVFLKQEFKNSALYNKTEHTFMPQKLKGNMQVPVYHKHES